METFDARLSRLLDQMEDPTLSPSAAEELRRKIEFMQGQQQSLSS